MQTLMKAPFNVASETKHPMRIIALGDSVIYGYGDPVGGGWVERLRRQWIAPELPGHALYNLGIRGNGVVQVAQRLEDEFRHRGELRNRYPDLIIFSVGINDSARLGKKDGKYYTSPEIFNTQLNQLLDKAQSLCPVIFVGMTPVDESKMPFLDCFYYNHNDQFHYKEITRQSCEDRKIPYLDVFDLWTKRGDHFVRSNLCRDGLHPNVQGYQNLLQDVLNWHPIAELNYCPLP